MSHVLPHCFTLSVSIALPHLSAPAKNVCDSVDNEQKNAETKVHTHISENVSLKTEHPQSLSPPQPEDTLAAKYQWRPVQCRPVRLVATISTKKCETLKEV